MSAQAKALRVFRYTSRKHPPLKPVSQNNGHKFDLKTFLPLKVFKICYDSVNRHVIILKKPKISEKELPCFVVLFYLFAMAFYGYLSLLYPFPKAKVSMIWLTNMWLTHGPFIGLFINLKD